MPELIEVLIPPLAQALTYEVPEEMRAQVAVGSRVQVPLGKRKMFGYVIRKDEVRSFALPNGQPLKTVEKVDGDYRHFDPRQLRFFNWVAQYYGDTLSRVIEAAIPASAPQKFERYVTLIGTATAGAQRRGRLQERIIQKLTELGQPAAYAYLTRAFRGAAAAMENLSARGIIGITSREILDTHLTDQASADWAKKEVTLNSAQIQSLQEIGAAVAQAQYRSFLLHGVTGSGKTEVYIEAVQRALELGKGALIIVPEIALTPQLIDRFRARLGAQIALLHSALNRRVRWDAWRALLEGRTRVAIGARSAIFAPVPQLGLIVVDEEHDGSYKQCEGLRYHARDLALVRGRLEACPVVLGSATPSLESYYNAMRKKYVYQRLPLSYASAPPSQVELVDLNRIKPWEMKSRSISPRLFDALAAVLARDEQAFILYNRRGFAAYLQCDRCEHVVECPNCSVTLTLHRHSNSLLCHYCGYALPPPTFCTQCEDRARAAPGRYVPRGAGTEHIADEIRELFPHAPLERLDRDTALDAAAYRGILDRVRRRQTRILVGTQMIAKGHDLPGVTLVGIADCDVGLHLPDFRAGEHTFQLLTQAAGRAGRADKPGLIILQTRVPQHVSLLKTVEKDFEGFARRELGARKELAYPPYARMLRIIVSSVESSYPPRILESFKERALTFSGAHGLAVAVLGPSPAPIERITPPGRWPLLLKSASAAALHKVMRMLGALKVHTGKARIVYDLDPQEMM